MKIAYFSYYVGPLFAQKCGVEYKPVSGTLKTQGMARAMLSAGHSVTIFSPGMNSGHKVIPAFEETIAFQEGTLKVVYPKVYSYPRYTPLNDLSLWFLIRKMRRKEKFDVFIYYNITDNTYLGNLIGVGSRRITKLLKELSDNNYITMEYKHKFQRKIYINKSKYTSINLEEMY